MGKLNDIINEQRERIAELEQAEKQLGETQLLLIEEQERNQRLIQRLAEVERELEAERIISMKRFVETGRADKFAIEQQIKALEWLLRNTHCCFDKHSPTYGEISDRIDQLRQQLRKDQDDEK